MSIIVEKSSLLWNLLVLFLRQWSLRETSSGLLLKCPFAQKEYPALEIKSIYVQRQMLWSTLTIVTQSSSTVLRGAKKDRATESRLSRLISDKLLALLQINQERLLKCWAIADQFLNSDIYIKTSQKEEFFRDWLREFDDEFFIVLQKLAQNPFFDTSLAEVSIAIQQIHFVLNLKSHFHEQVRIRNEKFAASEMIRYERLFKVVEKMPLTDEQCLAAIHFEDANLLIASAGSGKTSSLVGKAIYALEKKYYEPQEILMLAFGSKAAEGLKDRFQDALQRYDKSKTLPGILTFHALGFAIVREVEGAGSALAPWAQKEDLFKEILEKLLNEICEDPSLNVDMTLLVSTLMFGNPTSFEQRLYYQDIFSESADLLEVKSDIREDNPSLRTLKGEMVRSTEELMIANWLYLHNINYVYEQPVAYEDLLEGGGLKTGEHKPDFFYSDVKVYHEHFGINKDGQAPAFLGKSYLETVKWKREFYETRGLAFFETRSAMFADGSVFDSLKKSLESVGLVPTKKDLSSVSAEFSEGQKALVSILGTVLKHIRNQGRISHDLEITRRDSLSQAFQRLTKALLHKYEDLLARERVLDFEEMLIRAAVYVEKGVYRSPYKFICIDEFQDISQGRRRLVKALLDQHKNSCLFAVGDDWQGIYRFAGADLDIFTRAQSYFGPTRELFLTNTFRSNQGIADLASMFVQKNPIQKKKTVRAHDKSRHGVAEVLTYFREHDAMIAVEGQLLNVAEKLSLQKKSASVFILSRYSHLLPHPSKVREWERRCQGALKISTMTFHASKGREADYVFILGMNSGPMGFPSMKYDHPFIQMYMAEAEIFPFAEERRLLYVALTRAKTKVFLVTRSGIPSSFLQELQKGAPYLFAM